MIGFNPFAVGYGGAGGAPFSQTMAGFDSWSSTATIDSIPVRMWLVSRARQLAISNPMAAAAIGRLTGGIVGEGLGYVVPQEADLLGVRYGAAMAIKRAFTLASGMRLLDVQRRQSFAQMQEIACRNWLLSGDVFFVRKDINGRSAWRAVESDRVISPYWLASNSVGVDVRNPETGNRIIDGVELDADAIPVAYWMLKDYIEKPLMASRADMVRIPAHDDDGFSLVLHLFAPLRPDQYRGIPILAETIESLFATNGFIRSVEQAAAFQSSVWGFITSENPTMSETDPLLSGDLDAPIPIGPKTEDTPKDAPTMELSTTPPTDADNRAWFDTILPEPKKVSAGQLWNLKPGEDVKFLQPTNPNTQFAEYLRTQTGMLASAIGVPLQVLSCSYDGTYASARGSVLEANRLFKRYRGFFIDQFVRPIFERFVYDETGSKFVAGLMAVSSQWQAPTALCLDPTKELDAWLKAIESGLVTRDEAALALYGHTATGTPADAKTEVIDKL